MAVVVMAVGGGGACGYQIQGQDTKETDCGCEHGGHQCMCGTLFPPFLPALAE